MIVSASRPVRSIVSLAASHPRHLVVAVLAHLLKDTPVWIVPVFTAAIIDTVVGGTDFARLWMFVGLTLLVLAFNYPLHLLYVRQYSHVYRTVAAELRNRLTVRLHEMSIGYLNRKSSAVLQTKIVRDVENVELMFQQAMPSLLVGVSILAGSITVTAIQVPAFLLVYALTIPISGGLIAVMRGRAARRNREFRLTMESLSSAVGDMAALIPITRAHGLEGAAIGNLAASAAEVRSAGLRLDRLNGRFDTSSWIAFNAIAAICLGLAAWASMSHFIPVTAGQVVLLSAYFATLTTAVSALVGLTPIVSKGIESIISVAEVLEDPDIEDNVGKPSIAAVRGAIDFEHVDFRFAGARADAVRDVTLSAEPGQLTAFVGSSGSGKSTLVNLALGFLRPTGGRLLIDGHDIQDLDMRSVRRFVSVVPQEPVLFEGSILDNITYGLETRDLDLARQALVDANAAEFVDELDDGWNSRVGQRGAQLSGGQKQRLAIARALIRDPRILILDEATSALDGESESKVKQALDSLMVGRTTLVVAHRLGTIRHADQIVVMEHGQVAEIGTHDGLLVQDSRYARLFGAQTS